MAGGRIDRDEAVKTGAPAQPPIHLGSRLETGVRRDWLGRLPKVELHLHLEGAIPDWLERLRTGPYGGPSCRLPAPTARRPDRAPTAGSRLADGRAACRPTR